MKNKKLENMTKKELMEKIQALHTTIDDMETQLADKDTAFASLHGQHVKFGQRAAKEIAEYEKKNEAIHEEAKRWKKEAVDAQAELDDLRASIGADDSDPISVAIWKAKYHTLKYQFDKLKDEDRKWTSANPSVKAALERKINVLEREINKYKAEASEWEAKYEYQDGQTDCVIKDYNALNKKYTALLAEHTVLSSKYNDMVAYFENRGDKKALEERIKDLIRQCDELYDKNKELDAENSYLTDEVDNLKKKLKDAEQCLKKTVNKMYGISSVIPDIADTTDFEDRARRCAIIFSKTIDDMIRAYNMDVNSYYDGSIAGVAKTVNTIRGCNIWLDALEESMRKFSEEAEKYIKRVGEKND